MKHTLLIILALITFSTVAQSPASYGNKGKSQQPEVGYGKISGQILDPENEPVPFATIALIDEKDGSTKDGTIADESGKFTIKSIPEGSYKVSISFIGFDKVDKGPYSFSGKGDSYDLGKVKMESVSQELDEVVVEGQRELMEEKVDRIIYNAEQDKTTTGGDASDVLRRVPLLSVDLDGNVSMRGSSNITVLIDNRPSTISASSIADALKQIPADQIKSVEVITSPSARYDAEGTGGIINIITKKNNLQGTSVSVNSSAGLRGSNLGVNASYRKGRAGFTLGGFGRAGYNIKGDFDNEQTLFDSEGNIQSITNQSASTLTDMLMGRYNLGFDYELNKYNWINASVKFGLFNFNNTQDDRITRTTDGSGELLSSNLQDMSTANLSNTVDVSLNYIKTFETKGKEFSVLSLYSQNSRVNDFENISKDENSDDVLYRIKNNNDSYNREFTVQADYVNPIGEKQIVEFGAKNIMREVTSDFTYFTAQGTDAYQAATGDRLSNVFDYNQNVTAGYVSYTVEFLKGYSLKAGGRYEYTTISANFEDEVSLELPSYGVLVPSVNISKKLGMGNTVKAAYNRRIQRPSLRFLNPNVDASNPNNISQGNPNLDPEYTDNFEVSYSTFKKGTSLNFSAFMRNTRGSIQQVREVIGQDTISSTYQNIGEEDAYGLSVFANIKIGKKFMVNGGVDGYYSVMNNNVDDPLYNASNSGFVLSGRIFGSYKLTDNWAFQFFSFFRGNQVQLQGNQTGFYIYSLSLNRSFNDDRGSIGIGAENFIGGKMKRTSEISSAYIDQYNTNVMYNMNFKINFSYRFGKLSVGQPRKRGKNVDNNDLKDGGDSGGGMMNN
ncbi:TonB-dependent receptor domain-containing protein [Marinoscillum pacificum]|uniref:TonB-dependent receptor domain-containing protein n=1 Tax=Marinoscillum pacificum TaxID=392723 RepID=UPI00215770EA|nr:TonB-dependent receptor [Marinoscillum pacificum]